MLCVKCGHEIMEGAAFCPYCGEKVIQGEQGIDEPVYQVDVKKLLKSGKLVVYRDRTEFETSSVQKSTFNYTGLVSVKKEWDHIDFITEDGRKESCPADMKCVHEAFLYIEQMSRPYLAQRKDRLLSQGIQYSFPSSQGLLNDGVLNLSAEQAEFKAKSGKSDILSFRDVKSVSAPAGTLDFFLFNGATRSFAVSKELRDEVLAFVEKAIEPYIAERKASLLSRGIYYSCLSSYGNDGGTLDVLEDRVEFTAKSGRVEAVFFKDVRTVSLYAGRLELPLTNGVSKSFAVESDIQTEALSFIEKAIEPYVLERTVGFDAAFGIDEQIEINEERGVFHIIRQSGREITGEWPLEAVARCEWVENKEMTALGSVVSGSIALFKSAAKAAGSQAVTETEEWISRAGVALTVRTEQGAGTEDVWFGIFSAGMSRTSKKYERYLAEWAGLSDYLKTRCPACELIEPAPPEPESQPLDSEAEPENGAAEIPQTVNAAGGAAEAIKAADVAMQQDDLGIAKYIEGVSRFIGNCATPMTIAFQGNRGSGESSILKMLYNRLRERYGNNLLWLNARQFSQGESGQALSILVGKRLAGLLSGEGDPAGKGQTGTLLAGLAGVVTGVVAGDSSIGKEMVGGLLDRESEGSPGQFAELVAKKTEARFQGGNGKVLLFIDGLDRLTPARAVELLEAMRDFFDCKGCVFVIAAEYSSLLRGARELYGQGFDENEGRRFFDELFKMSFRVPASGYNVPNYVKSKLEHMDLRVMDEAELGLYVSLIQNSVGRDPESIDRLFTSYQLFKDTADEETYKSSYKRLALFALLCMQTRFRDAYDYAIRMRDSVTPEFLAGLCGESIQFWSGDQTSDAEKAAFRDFGAVFANIINLDEKAEISEAECRAFAEVLELSSVTSKWG